MTYDDDRGSPMVERIRRPDRSRPEQGGGQRSAPAEPDQILVDEE